MLYGSAIGLMEVFPGILPRATGNTTRCSTGVGLPRNAAPRDQCMYSKVMLQLLLVFRACKKGLQSWGMHCSHEPFSL